MFEYVEQDRGAGKWLILLHGTGGDKYDLLPLTERLVKFNVLGLSGNVMEQGMRRFFARKDLGIFNEESIDKETKKLGEFMSEWKRNKGVKDEEMGWMGYSNGANMVLAMMFAYPEMIKKAVLLHPMWPLAVSGIELETEVLVTYGKKDVMVSEEESVRVVKLLGGLGAKVKVAKFDSGHEIGLEEREKILEFWRQNEG